MRPSVSVVIVNYNGGDDLERCLDSLAEHGATASWDGVVVDNASTDGSERVVARFTPRVRLIRNHENLGFGRGINQGMAATAGDAGLFLNPDCRVTAGAIDRLRDELQAHPECAILGPGVTNDDGSPQGSARGDPTMLTGLFGRSTLLTRLFPRSAIARRNVRPDTALPPGETSLEVDWVSGSCMLVRRDVFERCGGFDEQYFLYWEDADLCRRVRAAGFRVRYQPGVRVVHSIGRSSRTARALAIRAFHRSAYLYYARHVARSPWHPARWMAYVLLGARCRWQLWRAGSRPEARV